MEKALPEDVFQSIIDAGLIHFTCHGHIKPRPCLQLANDLSQRHCLTLRDLKSFPPIPNSLIFANACFSASAVFSSLGVLCSFGWEFYEKNAKAYIGTLGHIPTEKAIDFAEKFYERLLNGESVGKSLHDVKSEIDRGNPFWLLYTLYGDPFAQL
jgi:hypothetical protein